MSMHAAFRKTIPTASVVAVALLATTLAARADDAARPTGASLPGVDRAEAKPDYRRPAPEPNDRADRPASERYGSFRVGDWDVRISGSVSYAIGFGDRPRRRR